MEERINKIYEDESFSRVLSDDLPDWAKKTNEAEQDNSNERDWVSETIETEGGDSTSSQRRVTSITICQNECQGCEITTTRGHHSGCKAPIVSIGGDWMCGECGVEITPHDTCFECGAEFTHNRVDVPLDCSPSVDRTEIESAVHNETNRYRTDYTLETLKYSPHLSSIALQHSRDMAERDFFDHICPDGNDAGDRYRHFGHDDRSSGENIACIYLGQGASTREAANLVVEEWMNSKGHRENILRGRFNREGIGIYFTSEGAMYATQNFY